MLCEYLEGWDGVGVGRRLKREEIYIYLWLIHVVVGQPTQHCKAIILQLKINLKKRYKDKKRDDLAHFVPRGPVVCSSVSLGGSHRFSLPRSTFSLSPGTSQHSQRLPVGWLGCVRRSGSFPPGTSSPALRSSLPRQPPSEFCSWCLLILILWSRHSYAQRTSCQHGGTSSPSLWCSGAAGRPLLPFHRPERLPEFVDMDAKSSEGEMGGRPEEREGRGRVFWGKGQLHCAPCPALGRWGESRSGSEPSSSVYRASHLFLPS